MKLPEYETHPKYSFKDASVSFVVEDRIKFDIHKHFLQRDSKFFDAILTAPSSHPDGIYRIQGLKFHEFESLLEFFYEGMYEVSPIGTPIESWINILSISTAMEFPRARERAITAIDVYQHQSDSEELVHLTPARMIQIANMYNVEKWLEPAYGALAERFEMIDKEEAEMIGMKGVLVIMKARETRLREVIRQMNAVPVYRGHHATGGEVLLGDETPTPPVGRQERSQEDRLLGGRLHEAKAQSFIDRQGSIAALDYSTVAEENANFCSGIKSVDPPVPSSLTSHSLDAIKPSEYKDVVELKGSSSEHRLIESLEQRLDCLYCAVLSANPDHERLHRLVAAILVLPGHLEPTPAHMEFLLGVPARQLVSRLPMVSPMLNIGGREDVISLHPSFRDFLADERRAGSFHVDLCTQKHTIARQWLEALSTSGIVNFTYEVIQDFWSSSFQPNCTSYARLALAKPDWVQRILWAGWADFCSGIEQPSDDLLSALQSMDLVVVAGVNSLIALADGHPLSMVAEPFKTIASWLRSVDPPVSSTLISRFLDAAIPFECEDVVERKGGSSEHRLATESSDERLDCLYRTMLNANPDHEKLRLMLATILILSVHLEPTLAFIELLLEMDVVYSFPILFSMLDVGSRGDVINLPPSFRDFLVDEKRAGSFHVDIHTQTRVIARKWLQRLEKCIRSNQHWPEENVLFFEKWIDFCTSIAEPTRDLLEALRNVDLSTAFVISGYRNWEKFYERLVPWVRKYGENQDLSEIGDHVKAGSSSHLKVNGQCSVEGPSRRVDNERHDLVERLVRKFQNYPPCFHLYWSGSPPDNTVYWVINRAAGCRNYTRLDGSRPCADNILWFEKCHCNLSSGNQPRDPYHLEYQSGCSKLVKAYVSLYEELSQSAGEDEDAIEELGHIFLNLTSSLLLIHCRLDMELLSLCRTLFGLAKGCLMMRINSDDGEFGRKNMLKWFESFQDTELVADREGLKEQVLGLPWERWDQNFSSGSPYNK